MAFCHWARSDKSFSASFFRINPFLTGVKQMGVRDCHETCGDRKTTIFTSKIHGSDSRKSSEHWLEANTTDSEKWKMKSMFVFAVRYTGTRIAFWKYPSKFQREHSQTAGELARWKHNRGSSPPSDAWKSGTEQTRIWDQQVLSQPRTWFSCQGVLKSQDTHTSNSTNLWNEEETTHPLHRMTTEECESVQSNELSKEFESRSHFTLNTSALLNDGS
jgi:hypothetical protein